MNFALTVEKMKEICNEYGFVCENGSIYYRKNKNNYIVYTQPFMSTPMKSVTLLKQRTFQRGL